MSGIFKVSNLNAFDMFYLGVQKYLGKRQNPKAGRLLVYYRAPG